MLYRVKGRAMHVIDGNDDPQASIAFEIRNLNAGSEKQAAQAVIDAMRRAGVHSPEEGRRVAVGELEITTEDAIG